MNRENTIAKAEIMLASAKGGTIQCRELIGSDRMELRVSDKWREIPKYIEPRWDWQRTDYRIKPKPKIRPWRPEEVPIGKVVVHTCKQLHIRLMIVGVHRSIEFDGPRDDWTITIGGEDEYPHKIMNNYTMEDGSPCGVTI